ncbi:MAG TPA: ACT domain-containing protein [Thermoanaerobaculia bacterium]|nr:ACT domain-containing protein [Thermoanaerobaculia bacterium]
MLGPDRPGLVDALAALVTRHGGNWLESRMASLAGEFAGILRVEVDADDAPALEAALRSLEADQGLALVVKEGRETTRLGGPLLTLELVGQDRPGSCARAFRRWQRRGCRGPDRRRRPRFSSRC